MKGRSVTAEKKRFHDLLCREIGCVACAIDGMFTSWVSVHHCDGRTKPCAQWFVLPLCGPHHQDSGIDGVIAVHPYKARFEAKYGTQAELHRGAVRKLLYAGFTLPEALLEYTGLSLEVA